MNGPAHQTAVGLRRRRTSGEVTMAMRNRVCTIRTVFLFGSALGSLMLGDSGLAFGSTGCDLVNAVGPVPSGTYVSSGVGKFEAGDTVKFLLPSPGLNGGLMWSDVTAGPRTFQGQRQTPTEF